MTRDLTIGLAAGYTLGVAAMLAGLIIGTYTRHGRRAAWLQVRHDAERVAGAWRSGDINLSDALEGLTQSVEHAHATEAQ